MEIIINASVVLANLLLNKETISVEELELLQEKIDNLFKSNEKSIYLDISHKALTGAIFCYPDMFSWDISGNIERRYKWTDDFVHKNFNWTIPISAREIFLASAGLFQR